MNYRPEHYNIINKITTVFTTILTGYSYMPVDMPLLENINEYKGYRDGMVKAVDATGKVYVVKPTDSVVNVQCFLDSLKEKTLLNRFYHADRCVSFSDCSLTKNYFSYDFFGQKTSAGLAEVLSVFVEIMNSLKLKVKVDIGHTELMNGILSQYNVPQYKQGEVVAAIKAGGNTKLPDEAVKQIATLSRLSGGVEVLNDACAYVGNKRSADAVLDLYELYYILGEYGYGDYVNFDCTKTTVDSAVNGIFFDCTVNGVTFMIGGRRENVAPSLGADVGTVTCKTDIDALFAVLYGNIPAAKSDVIMGVSDSITALSAAKKLGTKLMEQGFTVDIVYKMDMHKTHEYAKQRQNENVFYVNDEGKTINL